MIDLSFYWSLPTPRRLLKKITDISATTKVIGINSPKVLTVETWPHAKAALTNLRVSRDFPLRVRQGTDLSADIGYHFDVKHMSASALAHVVDAPLTAIFLQPEGIGGWNNARDYVMEFIKTLRQSNAVHCPIRIILDMQEDSISIDSKTGEFSVFAFDGGISSEEMDAYVAMRMIEKMDLPNGLDTGELQLHKSLIASMAGFDPELAEKLLSWEPNKIISVTDNLTSLLDDEPARWSTTSWINGTINSHSTLHTLRHQYLKLHGSAAERISADKAIKKLYWKACVKTITPWIEEIRPIIVKVMRSKLKQQVDHSTGKLAKPISANNTIYIDIDDVELSGIAWMENHRKFPRLNSEEDAAVSVCLAASDVRNEIAHLRAPATQDVMHLVTKIKTFESTCAKYF